MDGANLKKIDIISSSVLTKKLLISTGFKIKYQSNED